MFDRIRIKEASYSHSTYLNNAKYGDRCDDQQKEDQREQGDYGFHHDSEGHIKHQGE
jgi:hypothetical protein